MQKRNDITGAILAGGKSSRMGSDKALLELDGVTFIQRIAATLEKAFAFLIVIADQKEDYAFLGLPVHDDIYKNCGPLAGIHSALTHAQTDSVFVTSCDVPLLTPQLIRQVIRQRMQDQVTLLVGGNSLQPLCGLYHRSCLPVIERHLEQGQYSIQTCLRDLGTTLISPSTDSPTELSHALTNVNTPSDYELVLRDVLRGRSRTSSRKKNRRRTP
jgi:molybdopterin-guanine dinucleotide biosynthesis protein A